MTETLAGGRYTLVRRIAQGGMGDVLLADFPGDAALSVTAGYVVVKRVLAEAPNRLHQLAMLREEGRVALRLLHDNLVETFFIDEHDGDPLLVMEFMSGRAMSQVLGQAKKRKELVPVEIALALLRAAACGLHFAHTLTDRGRPLGLIHRDVSPANLFVTFDGRVKVIDFGVAKADDSEIRTSTGILKGKLGYMSPEHALGDKLTPASDMWSLGVLFWETLCAERLFVHPAPSMTLAAISEKPVPLPTKHRPDLPTHIVDLCMGLLDRDLDRRIGTGAKLVAAIDKLPEAAVLPRVDLGSWLSGRFPEEAEQGTKEAGRAARMRRRTPVPIGLVEGTATSVPTDGDSPTIVLASAAGLVARDLLEAEDAETLRMKLGGTESDEATTKRLGRAAGLLADSDKSGDVEPSPATLPDTVDLPVDLTRTLPELNPPPQETAGHPRTGAHAHAAAPGRATVSRTMPVQTGSSWIAVAFLTFGALALAMGVAFSFVAPRIPVRTVYAFDDATGQTEVLVASIDAPANARPVDVTAPEVKIAGALVKMDPAELERALRAAGVMERAALPTTPRGTLALILPVAIAALGLLALALSLPAIVIASRNVRTTAQIALLVVSILAVGAVVKRGALSWPGLDARATPAALALKP